jgi:16S rRNA (cytosine1407-C5)-methyltransferase
VKRILHYLCCHKTVQSMKLPSSFTDYTRALLGVEEYEKLAAALEGEQPVSIRLNEDKLPESSFSLFRSSFRHVPWSTIWTSG